ncbi:MAG: bifunctional nuclease family protein [Acidobacteriota bacterium]
MRDDDDLMIEMDVKALMTDPVSQVPIVILRNDETARFLPIWIGAAEANAIALRLQEVESPRPMTHDLMVDLVDALESEVVRIVVCDLAESTFYAEVVLERHGEEISVDSRPSDAIALALRADAPIFVLEDVLEKAKTDENTERLTEDEKIKKLLEELDPDDMGEYTM